MSEVIQYILIGAWLGIVTLEWVKLVYSSSQKEQSVSVVLRSKQKRGRLRCVRNMDCANYAEVG